MFDRFDEDTRRAFGVARRESERLRRREIDTEHLLLGIAAGTSVATLRLFRRLGIEGAAVRTAVESLVTIGAAPVPRLDMVPFTPATKRVLEATVAEAKALGHVAITPIHLLLGLIAEKEGVAARALRSLGLDAGFLRAAAGGRERTGARDATGSTATRVEAGPYAPDAFAPLSERARASLDFACEEASIRARDHIDTEHVLLGLVRVEGGFAFEALRILGLDLARVRAAVDRRVTAGEPRFPLPDRLPLAPGAAATFERGRAEADRRGDVRLGTGYLLLGLLEDRDGIASQVVSDLGVDCVHLCAEATARLAVEADD